LTDNNFTSFRNLVKKAAAGIKGNMSDEDIKNADLHLASQALMQFKNWMPGFLKERFGGLSYDEQYDITNIGRYRSVISNFLPTEEDGKGLAFITQSLIPSLGKMMFDIGTFGLYKYKFNETRAKYQWRKHLQKHELSESQLPFDSYLEAKQGGTRAALGELRQMLALAGVILMLGQDWDDDGEENWKETMATRNLYRLLNRAESELTFAYNPNEFFRLVTTNPVPSTRLIKDLMLTLDNTIDEAGDAFSSDKDSADKTGPGYYSTQWIIGSRQLARFFELFEQHKMADR